MQRDSIITIVRALNESGVRYLIVGGLAVVAHGYLRFTADLDLMLDLETANVNRCIDALKTLGYRPRVPVPFEQFADAAIRERWIQEKNLTVFSLASNRHMATEIDLFAHNPLDFDAAYTTASHLEIAPGVTTSFIAIDDLIRLKKIAGRPQDWKDIEELEKLRINPDK